MRIRYPFLALFLACMCVVSTDVTGERPVAPAGMAGVQAQAAAPRQTDAEESHTDWLSLIPAPMPLAADRAIPKIVIDLK